MPTDFISTYVPAFVELTPEEILDCRERLETFSRTMFPELDTAPNTVLGDLILTPQAYQIAALEKGMDRFMSDLDLGNIAQDKIYNCDFVAEYLKNFAVDNASELRSSGVIRLVFTKDDDYILDRGLQFSLNNFTFSIYLPNNGVFTIHKVGTVAPSGTNGTTLIDAGSSVYFADVPVVGHASDVEVESGTPALLSAKISNLGAATALTTFSTGTDSASLPELAERARSTIYAASLNTRNGAVRYLNSACPFVDSAYAIKSGDAEMLRGYTSNGVATNCLDVYARSTGYNFTEEQTVKLYYNSQTEKFLGKFNYTGQPYYIDSITNPNVEYANIEHSIYAVNTAGLGARGAYTGSEDLYIEIPDQKDTNGDSIFNPSADSGGTYANFTVTYHTDPMFKSIAATLENEDYTPVNANLLARGFIPVVISRFNVKYVKKDGVVPDLETAEASIRSYMDSVGAPYAYATSEISKIMGEAGVKYMTGVDVKATVQWTLGNYITKVGSTTLESINKTADARPTTIISSADGLRVTYPGTSYNKTPESQYACSIRNIRYYMLDTAVSFTEVKEM